MAMHCQEASERMHLAIDGMLEPSRLQELEEHLAACPACRQRHDSLHEAVALMDASQMAEPPSDMTSRVMREIRARQRRRHLILTWARVAMWAILAVAMAALAVLAVSTAQEMLSSNQSIYASVLRNVLALYQFGMSIARGMRVILVALFRQTNTGMLAIYAVLATVVAIAWVRVVVARGASGQA